MKDHKCRSKRKMSRKEGEAEGEWERNQQLIRGIDETEWRDGVKRGKMISENEKRSEI